MNIYKTASTGPLSDNTKSILSSYIKDLVRTSRNPGQDFESKVVSILTSMYSDFQSLEQPPAPSDFEYTLKSIVEDQVGADVYYRTLLIRLGKSLGHNLFTGSELDFSSSLDMLRSFFNEAVSKSIGGAVTETAAPPSPAPTATPMSGPSPVTTSLNLEQKVSRIRGATKISDKAAIISDLFTIEDLRAYFNPDSPNIDLDYSKQKGLTENTLKVVFRNMLDVAEDYFKSPRKNLERELLSSITTLLEYGLGISKDFDDEEAELDSDLEITDDEEDSAVSKEDVKEESDEDSEDEKQVSSGTVTKARVSIYESSYLADENIKNRIKSQYGSFLNSSAFIDFPDRNATFEDLSAGNLPSIDLPALESFSTKIISRIVDMYKLASKGSGSENKGGLSREFNSIMYTVKKAELDTHKSINEYRSRIESIIPTSQKESEVKAAQLLKIDKVKEEFLERACSYRILNNSAIVSGIADQSIKYILYYITLSLSGGRSSKFFAAGTSQLKADSSALASAYSSLEKYIKAMGYGVQPSEYDEILTESSSAAVKSFYNKLGNYLSPSFNGSIDNFISASSLKFQYIINMGLSSVYNIETDYRLRPCPVCFKMIPSTLGYNTSIPKEERGFTVSVVSPVKEESDGTFTVLTDDSMRRNIQGEDVRYKIVKKYADRFKPRTGRRYKEEELEEEKSSASEDRNARLEFEFVNKLVNQDAASQGYTWDEITALVLSSDSQKHREGWHRRAAALLGAGGKEVSRRKSINEMAVKCPSLPVYNGQGSPGSYCGASTSPVKSTILSSRIASQPQFNGSLRSLKDEDVPARISQGTDAVDPSSSVLLRSGYKFSSLTFACPCHISNPDKDSSKLHRNLVISKGGPSGGGSFVPPTNPDGSQASIPNGTVAFMVCAAPTSISSFNRDENAGNQFILECLLSTAKDSPQDYYKFLNYLVQNGMDPQDIMALNTDLEKYYAMNKTSAKYSHEVRKIAFDYRSEERINKVSEIIAYASKPLKPSKGIGSFSDAETFNRILGKIYLVCPFGHRFKIEDSLKFGEAYSAVHYDPSRSSKFLNVSVATGLENASRLISTGILQEYDGSIPYKNAKVYKDWLNVPEAARIVSAEKENPDYSKALLIFEVPDENGVIKNYFLSKKHNVRDSAWLSTETYTSKISVTKPRITGKNFHWGCRR